MKAWHNRLAMIADLRRRPPICDVQARVDSGLCQRGYWNWQQAITCVTISTDELTGGKLWWPKDR